MRFAELAAALDRLERTTSRLTMYDVLGDLLARAPDEDLGPIAYLAEARLAPSFAGVETGMGERTTAAAVADAAGVAVEEVDKRSRRAGDLGLVAEALVRRRARPVLTIAEVHDGLIAIARASGSGSGERKRALLAALLARATPLEARYLVRLTLGRLRVSVGSPTIIESIARASDDRRRVRAAVERAFNVSNDLGLVLETYRARGVEALERFKVRAFNPVRPMLAQRLNTADDVFARLGPCAVEEKLDGLRFQVHVRGERVEIFSRNLERTTASFPDIVAAVRSGVRARSAILDAEALAFDDATGEYHPFQVTAQRKRVHKTAEMAESLPLVLAVFDLLYVDGRDLTARPYEERRAELGRRVSGRGRVRLVPRTDAETAGALEAAFDDAIARGLEGLIVKERTAPYEPGGRSFAWIKLKRNYRGGLDDTVDVAVVGYIRGRGARARLGIGSLVGAVYDDEADAFETVAKIGSGLGDAAWIALRERLDALAVKRRPARVVSRLEADVWVEPSLVVTVLADEITRSPVHTAARDAAGRGLALRFPRVVGGGAREDKSAADATTAREIAELFELQRR